MISVRSIELCQTFRLRYEFAIREVYASPYNPDVSASTLYLNLEPST